MTYIGYQLLFFIANYFPKKFAYTLGRIIGEVGYYLLAERRDFLIEKNIVAFKGDRAKAIRVTKSIFTNFVLNLLDFFSTYSTSQETLLQSIKFTNLEMVQKLLSENKSALLTSVHIGNWELAGVALAYKGIYPSALVLEPEDKKSWGIFDTIHKKFNIGIIYTNSNFLKEISEHLKKHKLVAVMADVHVEGLKRSIEIPFLDNPLSVSPLISILAKRYDLPILPIHTIRTGESMYEITFGEPIIVQKNESEQQVMQKVLAASEQFVKQYPEQYYYLKFKKD